MQFVNDLRSRISLLKKAEKCDRAELFGAFEIGDTLIYELKMPRTLGAASPIMEIYRDDDHSTKTMPFDFEGVDSITDIYTLKIRLVDICSDKDGGLFYYTVLFDTPEGRIRISSDEYSGNHVVKPAEEGHSAYQLLVYSGLYVPEWLKGGIIYQIFVDRFSKGGDVPVKGDAVMNDDWYNGIPPFCHYVGERIDNNVFFGGTLFGAADKLDYIKSLGVSCIYLNPIFEAFSNHKYDTADYSKVDAMFGGDEALDLFISECDKRGIRVILDGVFNHTGSDSIYFNRKGKYDSVGAYNSEESPYFEWYDFYEYPNSYRCWWGVDVLPSVNTENESFDRFINSEDGIIRKYLRRGISGWRLDVADELKESFLANLYKAAKAEKSDALVLGEVWEDASNKIAYSKRRHYFRGELDSVMNYPFRNGIISFVMTGSRRELYRAVKEVYSHYPKCVSDSLMNLLGTHDTERILTALSGVDISKMSAEEQSVMRLTDEQRETAKKRLRIAYLLLATLPGVPCIYYGDEIGMEGGKDPFNRRPYPWGREDKELLSFYRQIGEIRRGEEVFRDGYLTLFDSYPESAFVFSREKADDEVVISVNLGNKPLELSLGEGEYRDLVSGNTARRVYIVLENGYAVLKKIKK